MLTKLGSIALIGLLLTQAAPIHAAEKNDPAGVYMDGKKLELTTDPVTVKGSTLVPMRSLFEAHGIAITWDNETQTVSATKPGMALTYRIGESSAYFNQDRIPVSQPGRILNGFTMVPLRFISETLGDLVQWHPYSGDITISSSRDYKNTVDYGVNLRVSPDAAPDAPVTRMLSKGEKIQVIREIDANWLEVRTQDEKIGFISAKPLYSDYESASLAKLQGDELIAFGERYLGTPYEFGAELDQTLTFDCSSFVHHVFSEVLSIDLPRVSYNQAKEGKEIGLDELHVGDLLFFGARGLEIGHVGIYAGDNRILHTFSKDKGVHIAEFDAKWKKRFVTARRLF